MWTYVATVRVVPALSTRTRRQPSGALITDRPRTPIDATRRSPERTPDGVSSSIDAMPVVWLEVEPTIAAPASVTGPTAGCGSAIGGGGGVGVGVGVGAAV